MPGQQHRAVVVGGGVIGLSVARVLAASHEVVLVDPRPAAGASLVAGGMLAPVTESWPGEEALLDLGSASLALWPEFAASFGVPLRTEGTIAAAVDAADAQVHDMLADHLAGRGRAVRRLTGRELREREPTLGPAVRSGLLVPGDLAVDNRELLTRMVAAARAAGVRFDSRSATEVRPGVVHLDDGDQLGCATAVIAAGAWSAGLHPALDGWVRPVKGEILRLRARAGVARPAHTVRALVESRTVYLVPRASEELVVGATQYEAGFDTEVTAGGVRDLLADAERVLPGLAEYGVVECVAGVRAGSRDNLPLIGWLEPGVLVAAGHHRNGLLLAPITSAAVRALIDGTDPPPVVAAADPTRLDTTAK